MSVQFKDQQNIRYASGPKGLTGFVIKWGLAKDAKSAQMVLLVIAVAAVLIGGFFAFMGGGGENSKPPFDPETAAPDPANF
jgi:hypothetical protein